MERSNFLGSGNDPFRCLNCDAEVLPLLTGFRNHCPECLWSRHVDRVPGDRGDRCGGLMEPVAIEGGEGTDWVLVHRCRRCGAERRNRTAHSDRRQPDRWERIVEVSARGAVPDAGG